MIRHTIRRVVTSIQLLFGISVVVFIIASIYPRESIANPYGDYDLVWRSDHDLAELQSWFGGDTPGPVRYLFWMKEVLTGNLGVSIQTYRPVTEVVSEAAPITLGLVTFALAIALSIGIVIALISAAFPRSILTRSLDGIPIFLASIPPILIIFWSIHIFVIRMGLGWLPAFGMWTPGSTDRFPNLDLLRHAILPTLVLVLPCIAIFVRHARQSMLHSDPGNPEQSTSANCSGETNVRSTYALRSATAPLLRNLSLSLPPLMGSAIVVEVLFAWPGLGASVYKSLWNRDYPVLTATLLAGAVAVLAARLLVDVICGWLEPSARGSSQGSAPTPSKPTTASRDAAARQIGPPLELIDRPLEHRPGSTARRRFLSHRPAVAGLVILLAFVAMSIVGPLAAPYSPHDRIHVRSMPEPSPSNWLGTDSHGRDVLSRLLHGARRSIWVGVLAVAISLVIGFAIGGPAGFSNGRVDGVLMWVTDLIMTFPALFLVVAIIGILGTGNVGLIIGIVSWPGIARLIRRQVLLDRHAADTADAPVTRSDRLDTWRRVARNLAGPVAAAVAYSLAAALLAEFTLSFLGLGSPFPAVSWGKMVGQSLNHYLPAAPMLVAPAALIVLLVLSVHLVGDGLRNAFDARR